MEFVIENQESRDPTHATITPILFGNQFRPLGVRLIGGIAELHPGTGIITKMRITDDSGRRNFHDGQGGWGAVTRNGGNRWVFPLSPTARGFTKLEEYFAKMGNCDLEV